MLNHFPSVEAETQWFKAVATAPAEALNILTTLIPIDMHINCMAAWKAVRLREMDH